MKRCRRRALKLRTFPRALLSSRASYLKSCSEHSCKDIRGKLSSASQLVQSSTFAQKCGWNSKSEYRSLTYNFDLVSCWSASALPIRQDWLGCCCRIFEAYVRRHEPPVKVKLPPSTVRTCARQSSSWLAKAYAALEQQQSRAKSSAVREPNMSNSNLSDNTAKEPRPRVRRACTLCASVWPPPKRQPPFWSSRALPSGWTPSG
eukprot:scaffold912_cov422-Prasinococcus_capsulatus_cf.AAC.23